MNRDDIIRMAEEADFGNAGMECIGFGGGLCSISTIERFAALVAAAEREACAQVCESLAGSMWVTREASLECSDAIRARGEK